MAFRTFTVKKWKKLANTANGNPVYSFELESSGHTVKGKTKPNAGFVFGIPSVYPGDKINVELSATPSGRVYMTDFARSNPTTRKTAARTQRAAESYVRRPSQITKKALSTRLKKRRTVNLQSPRGVFPNPKARSAQSAIFKKANELMREGYERKQAFAVAYSEKGEPKRARKNPDSVHFDIDVNSHNAKGAKARTRVNPARRKSPKTWIFVQKAYGKDDWSYLGYFDDTPDGSARAIEYAKAYHIKDPRAKIRVFTGPMK